MYNNFVNRLVFFSAYTFIIGLLLVVSPSVGETDHPMDRLVIRDGEIKEFSLVRGPDFYRPESLWNYINGGALPYLDYGVGDVVTYAGIWLPDSLEIIVDVYDMADSLGAFGIFSNERFPEYDMYARGVDGYITENSLCFWKDRYYVKVFSFDDTPSDLTGIERIAGAVDDRIPGGGGIPLVFSLFPEDSRLARTESYLAKNVLGQEYLKNACVVNYLRGDEEYQLYLITALDNDEAGNNFHAYRDFLKEYGELSKKQLSIGDEAFVGKESWYGVMVFVRKGKYIIASVGLSDLDSAQSHINKLMSGLH